MNYTYMLRCADGTLYCGWTNHLKERVNAHNLGRGAKYTRGRGPVILAYYECYGTKEEAMRREAVIKKMTKEQKEHMIQSKLSKNMRIIISPAKRMQVKNDELPWGRAPALIHEAEELLHRLREYTEPELKRLYRANDSITHENYLRCQNMDLTRNLTPALLAYVGIQYQYIAPQIFSKEEWNYVCRHLRILSGFYGILKADDGIVPYRLELQAKLCMGESSDLYGFWKDRIYKELIKEDVQEDVQAEDVQAEDVQEGVQAEDVQTEDGQAEDVQTEDGQAEDGSAEVPAAYSGCRILNLASKEYSRAIEPYLHPADEFVTCIFAFEQDGKIKVKATEAKMARGEMVRYLAEKQGRSLDVVKNFDRLGYAYCKERSTDREFVFIKRGK